MFSKIVAAGRETSYFANCWFQVGEQEIVSLLILATLFWFGTIRKLKLSSINCSDNIQFFKRKLAALKSLIQCSVVQPTLDESWLNRL